MGNTQQNKVCGGSRVRGGGARNACGRGLPLWEELVPGQVAGGVALLVVVGVLGLHGVGGQQHGGLGRAVDVVVQDALLHLEEEQPLGGLLDQLLRHVLREELGPELEEQRALLPHVLGRHLLAR